MFKRICLIALLSFPLQAFAKSFYAGDTGKKRLVKIDEKGEVIWQLDKVKPGDFEVLDNGNILFCHSSPKASFVREVTPKKETIWEYREKAELRSCQRLEDGNTVIGQTTDGLIRIVDSSGRLVKTITIKSDSKKPHSRLRIVRKGKDGLYYVSQHSEGIVRAYNEEGSIVREIVHLQDVVAKADKAKKHVCYSVTPLDNGHVLTSGLSEIKLFDENNQMIWSLKDSDIPDMNIYSFTGTHVLENGNIVVANWLGHGAVGKGVHLVEVNREKDVVWSYKNDTQFKMTNSVKIVQ